MTRAFRAPGRVNLIGEHTDYNDGFVMPIAIDRGTTARMTPRNDRTIVARSGGRSPAVTIDLDRPGTGPTGGWTDYVRGVAAILERRGHRLTGVNMEFDSDVPVGAGLSSSAALEVSAGYGLLDLAGGPIDLTDLARACQQAEHEFVGARCGVMDQFIACHGRTGFAVMLDTRTLTPVWVPMPGGAQILICNSMTKHSHASSGYNERRADCETGVRALAAVLPGIRALRDVRVEDLEAHRGRLDPRVYRRCRHVVTENDRVLRAADALKRDDVRAFGALMVESHRSMRDDYEISTPELDTIVDAALDCRGVHGARMTGGGFGGCAIALVDNDHAGDVTAQIRDRYREATGRTADIYPCTASDGVKRVA